MVIKSRVLRSNENIFKEIFVSQDVGIAASFLLSDGKGLVMYEELGSYRIHDVSVSNLLTKSTEETDYSIKLFKHDQIGILNFFKDKGRVDLYKKTALNCGRIQSLGGIKQPPHNY